MLPIQHAAAVLDAVASKTDKVILFFSCGKDSLALLDMCSKRFKEVHLVFMYFVKNLDHINRYLVFAKYKYSNIVVHEVPHWNLTYILRGGLYCEANPDQKIMKLIDVDESIRIKTGINWSIFGMKKADSMNRRIMLKGYDLEAINYATQKAYPLSTWKDAEVLRYVQMNGLPEPINYEGKKRSSGVGFDLDVFLYLRKNYPNDLHKILTQFPMSERILFDHDEKERKKSQFKQ